MRTGTILSVRSALAQRVPFGVILLALLPAVLRAQAWPKGEGEGYIKISYGSSTASEQYTFDGRKKEYADNVADDAFFDRSIYAYAEYGLTSNLTLTASLPYKRLIVRDAAFRYRTFAFGTATVGGRFGLKDIIGGLGDADALAANFSISAPTGYTRNYLPSVGAGQVDMDLSVSYGRSFYPTPAYAQGGVGLRYRSGIYSLSTTIPCQEGVDKDCFTDRMPDFGDELLFAVEGGYTFGDLLFVNLVARGSFSLTPPTEGFSVGNPIPTRQRYIKTGATVAVRPFDFLALSAQAFATPYGLNTVNSFDLFLGVDYSFKLDGSQ